MMKGGCMKLLTIIKAKKKINELYHMLNYVNLDQLPIRILKHTESEMQFRYENIEGKIIISDAGLELYALYDIYHNEKLLKGAYHYDPKPKNKNHGEMLEFSRSGTVAPGPC